MYKKLKLNKLNLLVFNIEIWGLLTFFNDRLNIYIYTELFNIFFLFTGYLDKSQTSGGYVESKCKSY
jgi:hypothetical protein